MQCTISPCRIEGVITPPPSKSHTLRALYFALLANGVSVIDNPLISNDTLAMCDIIPLFGGEIERTDQLKVKGLGSLPKKALDVLNVGNSGILYRFLTALGSLIPNYTVITGDHSIRNQRPIAPLLNALEQLGAFATAANGQGAPVIIKGPLTGTNVTIDGSDSQFVSALIYAAAFAPHPIEIHVENMKEKPWVDLSLSWLDRLMIPYTFDDTIRLEGNTHLESFSYRVPADFSSAAPFVILQALGHPVEIQGLDMNDMQGDKVLKELLDQDQIDMDQCIDLLPLLAVYSCFRKTKTTLFNAKVARTKECDRLASITQELRKMGAKIDEQNDSLTVYPSKLTGANLECHNDHRMAMALSVAALNALTPSILTGVECVNKTYPQFFNHLGVSIESHSDRLQTVG